MKKVKVKFNKKLIIPIVCLLVFIVFIFMIIGLVRSRSTNSSPEGLIKSYFQRYTKEDRDLVKNITYPYSDKLSTNQKKRYDEIIKKHYRSFSYFIADQNVLENDATMTIEFSVIDLKSAYDKANSYVEAYKDKFMNDKKEFDVSKAVDYKLEQLEDARDTVDYSIIVTFYKDKLGKWVMNDLSEADLSKIDGTF